MKKFVKVKKCIPKHFQKSAPLFQAHVGALRAKPEVDVVTKYALLPISFLHKCESYLDWCTVPPVPSRCLGLVPTQKNAWNWPPLAHNLHLQCSWRWSRSDTNSNPWIPPAVKHSNQPALLCFPLEPLTHKMVPCVWLNVSHQGLLSISVHTHTVSVHLVTD